MPDTVVTTRTEYPDSIEIGTPGRGGNIKIYFNANNLAEAQVRIDNAVSTRTYLLAKLSEKGWKP